MESIEEKIRELPSEPRQESEDFVEFLLDKRLKKPRDKPDFSWTGALQDLRDEYTSAELQHRISQWRIGDK